VAIAAIVSEIVRLDESGAPCAWLDAFSGKPLVCVGGQGPMTVKLIPAGGTSWPREFPIPKGRWNSNISGADYRAGPSGKKLDHGKDQAGNHGAYSRRWAIEVWVEARDFERPGDGVNHTGFLGPRVLPAV